MLNLNIKTNQEINDLLKNLVKKERLTTSEILMTLKEAYERRIFASLGYGSIFEYCVKELGYSEGAAHRRIASMKLLREVPEIEGRVKSGKLNLSTLAMTASFCKGQTREMKKELIRQVESKSQVECEKMFKILNPKFKKPETIRRLSENTQSVTLVMSEKLLKKLKVLQDKNSHKVENMLTLIEWLVDQELERVAKKNASKKSREKNLKILEKKGAPNEILKTQCKVLPLTSTAAKHCEKRLSRYIPTSTRHLVFERANHRCEFVGERGRCNSTWKLEVEHVVPFALGGNHDPSNLKVFCKVHNLFMAERVFGEGNFRSG